jgi:hypothetical protein
LPNGGERGRRGGLCALIKAETDGRTTASSSMPEGELVLLQLFDVDVDVEGIVDDDEAEVKARGRSSEGAPIWWYCRWFYHVQAVIQTLVIPIPIPVDVHAATTTVPPREH